MKGVGLALMALAVLALSGCSATPSPEPVVMWLPPPCIVEPAPVVPAGNTQRAAALYIERLYAWGARGWACIGSQWEARDGEPTTTGGRDDDDV